MTGFTGDGAPGRFRPWPIALGAAAVAVFVAGTVWAVTGPSTGVGNAPDVGRNGGVAGQQQDGQPPAGTPAPGSPSGAAHPSAGSRPGPGRAAPFPARPRPGGSGVPTASATASASDVPLAAAAGLTTSTSVSTWSPNGMQVSVTITAGSAGTQGWQATVTCRGGLAVAGGNLWGAERVSSTDVTITVHNLSWNGALTAGKTAQFGFVGTWSGSGAPNCSATAT